MEAVTLCIAYPNKFTYSETFIRDQIEGLQPEILLHEGWNPSMLPDGKSFLPFPLNYLVFRGAFRNAFPGAYSRLFSHWMASFLKKNRVQVVLAQYGPMGVGLMDACRQAGVGLVVHFHGFDAYHFETLAKYGTGYKLLFRQADALIAVSQDMKEQLMQLGAEAEKVYVNPCGVDTSKFTGAQPGQAPPQFIAVGRFTEKKGALFTLKAFAKVAQLCPEARLIMIGSGNLQEQAEQLAVDLGIAEVVEFRGVQTQEQIVQALRKARVFVQHSMRPPNGDSEGTPVSVLEAASTGLPVVSTLHAGIKDAVVHGESGFLVEEGDVEGMADYMYLLATDSRLAHAMGVRGRQHMQSHYELAERTRSLEGIVKLAVKT
jgi:glycosyltransferase involved in cell wall biosynthesis